LPVNSLATDDRRGAQVVFTFNSHARRQLREKVSSWDLVVTGVPISGDSQLMEDGLQLTECEPAVPIATRSNILEHLEGEIPVPPIRPQRLQNGAVGQDKIAITNTLV
jgi:hypothetical protein